MTITLNDGELAEAIGEYVRSRGFVIDPTKSIQIINGCNINGTEYKPNAIVTIIVDTLVEEDKENDPR